MTLQRRQAPGSYFEPTDIALGRCQIYEGGLGALWDYDAGGEVPGMAPFDYAVDGLRRHQTILYFRD